MSEATAARDEDNKVPSGPAPSPALLRIHAVVGVVLCVLLPGGSYLQGDAIFAWNMFSKSETYRVSVRAVFADGATRDIDPRAIGPRVGGDLATFLPAPGTWRHDPVGLTFRTSLPLLAAFACPLAPGALTVDIALEERAHLNAPIRRTEAYAKCR